MRIIWFVLILLITQSCKIDAPGKGKRAEVSYEKAKKIVEALETFKKDSTYYPEYLYQLYPNYVNKYPPVRGAFYYEYECAEFKNNYTLTFVYIGPGTNKCTWLNTEKDWKCFGYY